MTYAMESEENLMLLVFYFFFLKMEFTVLKTLDIM